MNLKRIVYTIISFTIISAFSTGYESKEKNSLTNIVHDIASPKISYSMNNDQEVSKEILKISKVLQKILNISQKIR